jgi:hypothetical protein
MRWGEAGPEEPKTGHAERSINAPTVIWIMLGVLLVLIFIALLVFVFHAPASWKADHSIGPPQRAPAPPAQTAPATTPAAQASTVS